MIEVTHFHNLSHIFISFIGAILTLALYFNIRNRYADLLEENDQRRVDKGLLYISLAFFVWVMAGIGTIIGGTHPTLDAILTHVFSLSNSIFLILALFYMPNASDLIYQNQKNIQKIIIGFVVLTIGMLVVELSWSPELSSFNYLAIPDIFMSFIVSVLLILALYKTFIQRGMPIVAWISVGVVLMMFISQYPVLIPRFTQDFTTQLLKIISKTSLILICLVLATTWVIELSNTPRRHEMKLEILDWSLIRLTIPSKNIINETMDFGSKTTQFKNLLKFAIRRKYGTGDEQAILIGNGGELKSQTYLTRIIDNLKEISTNHSNLELERKDLFTFLGEGKYRLRLLPEHISIEPNLLIEFSKQSDNQYYMSVCN